MRAYTTASERTAGYFLTATLATLAVGRVVSTALMRYIPPSVMMGGYALVNLFLLAVVIGRPGMIGAYAILATSFFMSMMYPTIFALGVKGLGEDTKMGGSLIVMAIVGGAVFPPAMGWVARLSGSIALGYLLPALGYVVVAMFAFIGPRISRRAVVSAPGII
jgi:FHS family L-fucose permease-like MFS transporter